MHAFSVRAMKNGDKVSEHTEFKNLPKYSPPKVNPIEYLEKLTIDPDKIASSKDDGSKVLSKLNEVNKKYHNVYNGDLSIGYNGASGPCTADWDFIQGTSCFT